MERVKVTPKLLIDHMNRDEHVRRIVEVLENDEEVQSLLRMSNIMAVSRLGYNDHGPVHARIVAGAALEILYRLKENGIEPRALKDGTAENFNDVKTIVIAGALLHDIGNSIHRDNHEQIGALLAKDILDRLLQEIYGTKRRNHFLLRQEILHTIYATAYNAKCLTPEAGAVKIADGLDMSEGRARLPYKMGKIDIHAVSALSIKEVYIEKGERPIRIVVRASEMAGLFQVENVLLPKIRTSSIENVIEVVLYSQEKLVITYPSD